MTQPDRRLLVLDTNVLMHDPTALFRFEEHDLFLPMVVLEELDAGKKGMSEVARNVRQVSRYLDTLLERAPTGDIVRGLSLAEAGDSAEQSRARGRLFLQTHEFDTRLPQALPGNRPDNSILACTLALMGEHPERPVALISKDINLRIKAAALGIQAEDYTNDRAVEDTELLFTGLRELPPDFWDSHERRSLEATAEGQPRFEVRAAAAGEWVPNEGLLQPGAQPFLARVLESDAQGAIIEATRDYMAPANTVWGINARNAEQSFALNLLMDPEVDFVTLSGQAGTGKTLLTLAAGLAQTLEQNRFNEIIMTRVTVPVGEDIGFLPGTEEEKMTPWMGALMDNLEVLSKSESSSSWEQAAANDLLRNRIKIRSMNFMRGRTFQKKFIILDEAQNLTPKQMKTLITRAGPGSKIVCLGNIAQIDTPYLTEHSSGLTFVVDRFKPWRHAGHVTLSRGERSRLADYAAEAL